MFDLDDCLIFITNNRSKVLSGELEGRLTPHHITKIQWMALYYVHKHTMLTQKQLAGLLSVKEPSLVRMVDKMESEQLLTRSGSVKDRRIKHLELTPRGEEVYTMTLPIVEAYKEDMTQGLSEEEERIMKKALDIMYENALNAKEKGKI